MKSKNKTEPIQKTYYEKIALILILAGALLVIVTIATVLISDSKLLGFSHESSDTLGALGEYIGGVVGSIWSLASIVLFYETLRFQRSELKLQRDELRSQRNEIMEQTNQYILQNQTLLTRRLEGTFFQIVSLHNSIVSSLKLDAVDHPHYKNLEKTISGRYCFYHYYKHFKTIYNENVDLTGIAGNNTDEIKELINESFKSFYSEYQEDIGHYLRNILNLLLFVDNSKLINKKFYYNIVRSLLSNYELLILFYYCISDYGLKMKNLAEQYSLFSMIPVNEIIDKRHMDLLNSTAYEDISDIKIDDTPTFNVRNIK